MPLLDRLLNLLYPPRCSGCGSGDTWLCASCRGKVRYVTSRTCPSCNCAQAAGTLCYDCRHQRLPLAGVAALCYYVPPVEGAIKRLKYRRGQPIAAILAALAANRHLPAWLYSPTSDLLLPVPLHPTRQRERGFNQSALLVAALAPILGLPFDLAPKYLRRVRYTRPQVGLDHEQRRQNVAGAFACDPHPAIAGKRIVLVDDVYTTGATISDCARALREGGAARVAALTIARPALSTLYVITFTPIL